MKSLYYIITCLGIISLIMCIAYTGYGDQGRSDANRVKVLTYNIYGGRNTDQTRDLDRIATVINTLNPDVVALQEVDKQTGRLNGIDLAAELGDRTGMTHVFGRAMKYDGGEYGEAILSKFPIVNVTNHALPTVPFDSTGQDRQEVEPRSALAVTLKFPASDGTFVLIGTHFDHLRNPVNRITQAKGTNEIAQGYPDMPVILAGDLNAAPDSETMDIIRQFWTDSWPSKKDVYAPLSKRRRNRRIDYVLYAPKKRWRVIKTYRGTEIKRDDSDWQELLSLASDHLPVMAEMELR